MFVTKLIINIHVSRLSDYEVTSLCVTQGRHGAEHRVRNTFDNTYGFHRDGHEYVIQFMYDSLVDLRIFARLKNKTDGVVTMVDLSHAADCLDDDDDYVHEAKVTLGFDDDQMRFYHVETYN